jgi:hypothetical protein
MCSLRSSWGCAAMKGAIHYSGEYSGETQREHLVVVVKRRPCAVVGKVGDELECIYSCIETEMRVFGAVGASYLLYV